MDAELILEARCKLAEGPIWFGGVLWFVDIPGRAAHRFDPVSGDHQRRELPQQAGAMIPRASGGFLLCMEDGVYAYDFETNTLDLYVTPPDPMTGARFNDAKCDPRGRLFCGTMPSRRGPNGFFYRVDPDGSVVRLFGGVDISNGLAWSGDGKRFFYIDTPTGRVDGFVYDPETGAIADRRPVVTVPEDVGHPDGMTIDDQDHLWVAHYAGARLTRWNAATGDLVSEHPIPTPNVTSCCFGGPNLDELYITTAGGDLTENGPPGAGAIYRLRPGVTGAATVPFSG